MLVLHLIDVELSEYDILEGYLKWTILLTVYETMLFTICGEHFFYYPAVYEEKGEDVHE